MAIKIGLAGNPNSGKTTMFLYVRTGVEELAMDKLSAIIALKYGSLSDGISQLGGADVARNTFLNLQQRLYL